MTSIRLPGYYRVLRKWYDAEPGSKAERRWSAVRDLLRLRLPRRTSSGSGAS